jgi:hypothetical protein
MVQYQKIPQAMRKIYFAFWGFVAWNLQVSAQSDVTRARWKSSAIVIDGNDQEWNKPLNLYDEKSGILYAIANDKTILYFDLEVSDPMKMRKMMASGWSVDLSSKEKGNKFKASLIFPPVNMQGVRNQRNEQVPETVSEESPAIKNYELMLRSVEMKGFRQDQTVVQMNDQSGVDIAVGENAAKQLVCEIAIPLRDLFTENAIRLNELILLTVNVNAFQRPSEGGQSGGGARMAGGMRGGGVSGFGGGGMRSGGGHMGAGGSMRGMEGGSHGGAGMGDRSAMFEKTSFKQKFKLTDN